MWARIIVHIGKYKKAESLFPIQTLSLFPSFFMNSLSHSVSLPLSPPCLFLSASPSPASLALQQMNHNKRKRLLCLGGNWGKRLAFNLLLTVLRSQKMQHMLDQLVNSVHTQFQWYILQNPWWNDTGANIDCSTACGVSECLHKCLWPPHWLGFYSV